MGTEDTSVGVTTDSDGPDAGSGRDPVDQANVYWVGHSLITGEDPYVEDDEPLPELLHVLTDAVGLRYEAHRHTTSGAPIGWNWGATTEAWQSTARERIAPLIDPDHPDYGTFDVIVVTEALTLQNNYEHWYSPFYARRFFCAARRANPGTRFFIYESWHHWQAADEGKREDYGPMQAWDWRRYMLDASLLWNRIADEAALQGGAKLPDDYAYQGPGADPGECDDDLEVHVVPVGRALVALLDRLAQRRPGDDWSYMSAAHEQTMSGDDLWANPYVDWPELASETVHGGDVDDVHPSHLLVYFNALVHYATIYRRDPRELPTVNGVPVGIADIMREVAWESVVSDPRGGVD